MNRKQILVLAMLLVLLGTLPVSAAGNYSQILSEYVGLYNDNVDQVPGIVKNMYAGERIELHVTLEDQDDEIIGIVTGQSAQVLELTAGEIEKPTLRVYIQGSTIKRLLENQSKEETLAVVQSLRIEGVGFFNKIKAGVLNLAVKIVGWFI